MVLFYSLSGVLQIFGLHQSHYGYTAPKVLVAIGSMHKDQMLAEPQRRPPPGAGPGGEPGGGPGGPGAQRRPQLLPVSVYALKWLFALEGLALAATTVFGLWIGFMQPSRRRTMLVLIVLGTVLPLILVVATR